MYLDGKHSQWYNGFVLSHIELVGATTDIVAMLSHRTLNLETPRTIPIITMRPMLLLPNFRQTRGPALYLTHNGLICNEPNAQHWIAIALPPLGHRPRCLDA